MIIDMHDLEEFGKEGNNEDDEGSFDIVPRTSADVMIDNPPKQVRPATLPQSRPELPRDLSTKSPMAEIDTSDRMHLWGNFSAVSWNGSLTNLETGSVHSMESISKEDEEESSDESSSGSDKGGVDNHMNPSNMPPLTVCKA